MRSSVARLVVAVVVAAQTDAFQLQPRRRAPVALRASVDDGRSPAQLTARNLLYAGAAVFPVGDVAVALDLDLAPAALASYAGIIIAFIGGLQQSVACTLALEPVFVACGIGVAIVGWLCSVAAAAGAARPALAALALLYAAQLVAERSAPWTELPPPAKAGMLSAERRVPMVVAVGALAAAAALC